MSHYCDLKAFPDVPPGLKALKEQGHKMVVTANPSREMLEAMLAYAGIRSFFDDIISNGDELKIYKPSPKVYELGHRRVGCPKDAILWITSHFWETVGAHTYGIKTCWVNRAKLPPDPIGVKPTITVSTMDEVAPALAKGMPDHAR